MTEPAAYRIPAYLVIVFSLLAVSIGVVGYLAYHNQKAHFIRENRDDLTAIADLKVAQLQLWREERLADANEIYSNRLVSSPLKEFIKSPGASATRKNIITWLRSLQESGKYREVELFDTAGNVRLALFGKNRAADPYKQKLVGEAIGTRAVLFADFHRSEKNRVSLNLVIPIPGKKENSPAIGALLLEIDPYQYLYPLIQVWPTQSETAETLLVRREGDDVVFLNELRHKKNTALVLRHPLTQTRLPAAMAALGKEGFFEGVDYRNVPVVAMLRTVTGSPWFLVAKVDQEEVFAPLRRRALFIIIIVAVLIIASGLSVGLWWRQQAARYYRAQFEASEELRVKTAELDHFFSLSADLLCIAHADGYFRRLNKTWETTLGYRLDELMQKKFFDFIHPGDIEATNAAVADLAAQQEVVNFANRYRCKDGTYRWLEWRSVPAGKLIYAVARDITERRQADEARGRMAAIVESSDDAIVSKTPAGIVTSWNRAAEHLFGYTEQEMIGKPIVLLFPPDRAGEEEELLERVSRGEVVKNFDTIRIRKDGSTVNISVTLSPIRDRAGTIMGVSKIARDITQRKQLEQDREKLIADLQKALAEIKKLTGILPICSVCKKIRNDKEAWQPMETYISEHSDAMFSHGYCPDCAKKAEQELKELKKTYNLKK